jgi:hypothetical protein
MKQKLRLFACQFSLKSFEKIFGFARPLAHLHTTANNNQLIGRDVFDFFFLALTTLTSKPSAKRTFAISSGARGSPITGAINNQGLHLNTHTTTLNDN